MHRMQATYCCDLCQLTFRNHYVMVPMKPCPTLSNRFPLLNGL